MSPADDFLHNLLRGGPSGASTVLILQEMRAAGRSREALAPAIEGLRRHPQNSELRLLLAELLLEQGFISLAERELQHLNAALRNLSRAFKLQAQIHLQQGNFIAAQQALDAYLAHRPEDP